VKQRVKERLQRERLNFQESWIVTDIVLKTDAQNLQVSLTTDVGTQTEHPASPERFSDPQDAQSPPGTTDEETPIEHPASPERFSDPQDAQRPPGTIEEEPQIDRNITEHQVISGRSTNPQAPTLYTKI
ncbi:hypothetical protein BgiBS90_027218, partial [Biomphalaria glabrata]